MEAVVRNIVTYDLVTSYTFDIPDTFEPNEQNVVRFLKDVRREHRVPGKAFLVTFPGVVFYIYRMKKNDFRIYKIL